MLSTLIRYDFKRLFKWILPACGLIVLSAAFFDLIYWRLSNPTEAERYLLVPYALLSFVMILGIYAGCLAGLAVICNHFYKNLMTDEGYLTFTLPVSHNQILASKVITGVVSMLLVALFAIAAIFIISVGLTFEEVAQEIVDPEMGIIGGEPAAADYLPEILAALFYGLTMLVLEVMQIYFATVMGCTVAKTHKVAASIGFWYLTGVVLNALSVSSGVAYLYSSSYDSINISGTLLLMSVLNIALCAGMYFWSLQRLKTKLNLQ